MAITIPTLAAIQAQVIAYFSTRFPGRDLGSEAWLGKQARALSMALLLVERSVQDADYDGSPTERTSTAALDTWAFIFGVPKNTGGYGRNDPSAASGGAGTLSGVNGTIFPDATPLLASDGVTRVRTSGAVTIPGVPPGSGTVAAQFVATTTGIAGNLAVGSVLTFVSPPAGADATVVLTSPLTGGLDRESDANLLARIYARLQQPPRGGAAIDYRFWSESASPAVLRGYVYPNRGGTGTVQVVIMSGGSGLARVPSLAVQTTVEAYVNLRRPVTVEEFRALRAGTAPTGMRILARLRPAVAKYNFDWDDTAAVYSTTAYVAGPPAVLTITPAAPASLKDAVTFGLRPRIQVEASSGPTNPLSVRVTAFNDILLGLSTQLTLENPLPVGFVAPAILDRVHAGGPIVGTIAPALLAYVDGLGPSRARGHADANDLWEDTCAIARLTETALDAVDPADGARLASNLAVVGGMTIDGIVADRIGIGDLNGAPELLYARRVVVTQ